jgi:hypothetical protein
MGAGAAREHVRVALALAQLPITSAALAAGTISFSKARAITRTARPETEGMLVEMARYATASQLEQICRGVRRADPEAERAQAERIENLRAVELHFDDDGMLVIQARLAPDEGAAFLRAIDAARREVRGETPRPANEERADALVRIAERSLHGMDATGGDRTQVIVHVDDDVLADPTQDGRTEDARCLDAASTTARGS